MKNLFKLFGIIAIVTVIGFSFAACGGNGNGNGGGGGGGGTFTLTGIPAQYNGMYAAFSTNFADGTVVVGVESVSPNNAACQISSGSVSIPMWIRDNSGYERYSGNGTTLNDGCVNIYNIRNITANSPIVAYIIFAPSVTFSNGNATRDWSAGRWEEN